jgi:two-component system sensor histidine kinase AlgZ
MTGQKPASPPADTAGAPGFFIPDFCDAQAVLFAVLLAELVVLLHVLALGPLAAFDWEALATASFFVQWNTLLCIALLCRLRRPLARRSPALATALCLLTVAAVTTLSSLAVHWVYPLLWPFQGSPFEWALRNVLLAVILAAIVLRYSYLQQRVVQQQRSALQLRLDALQARIRPHFLFNTLNSIASLIGSDPPRAEAAVEDMAELFRAALRVESGTSSLGEERRLCERYLQIEQLRLGDRLRVRWDLAPGSEAVPVPALTLQPLVENAVYHGVSQLPEGGTIAVRTTLDGERLRIEVDNPAPAGGSTHRAGNRLALENIRQRLAARYGSAARLDVEAGPGSFRARLSLPRREGAA